MNRTILEKIRDKIKSRSDTHIHRVNATQKQLDREKEFIETQKEFIDECNKELERKILFRREQQKFLYGR